MNEKTELTLPSLVGVPWQQRFSVKPRTSSSDLTYSVTLLIQVKSVFNGKQQSNFLLLINKSIRILFTSSLEPGVSLLAQAVKNLLAMQETQINPGSGRSPGEGGGHSLQYSCLQSSMGLAGSSSPWGHKELDITKQLTLPLFTFISRIFFLNSVFALFCDDNFFFFLKSNFY